MHLNLTPDPPPAKPCARDMHELVYHVLTEPLIKLAPMKELRRRCHEITVEHPRFREEVPLVLVGEQRRRSRLSGQLVRVGEEQSQVA